MRTKRTNEYSFWKYLKFLNSLSLILLFAVSSFAQCGSGTFTTGSVGCGALADISSVITTWTGFSLTYSWTNGPTSVTTTSRYTKIGKLVYFEVSIVGTANGSNTTNLNITLPVTPSNNPSTSGQFSGMSCSSYLSTTMNTTGGWVASSCARYSTQSIVYVEFTAAKPQGVVVSGFYEID